MLVLAIESSTHHASVALGSETEVVGAYQLGRGRTSDRFLVHAAEQILADADLEWRRVGGIAVGLGPGLFTGLRVGVATAKALAQALTLPIVGLSSLDMLAYSVRHTRRGICTCMDARRGEVFWGFYRAVPGGVQRVTDFRVDDPAHCANEIEARGESVLVVGNGALHYREAFEGLGDQIEVSSPTESIPTAIVLPELASRRFTREDADDLYDVNPLYVRKSDAEITWERLGRS